MSHNIGMISLGCDKNRVDAEIMLGILKDRGHNIVANPDEADVLIINTCGFIESAKQESIDTILEMAEYKNSRCKLLIVTGCLAERYNTELLEELPEVDALLGIGDFDKIGDIIDRAFSGERAALFGNCNHTPDEGFARLLSTPPYTAYLKIADGCDNNCTYCAIPKIRGKFRSRRMEDILDEAKELVKSGVKELIIIAQDTTRYGLDVYGKKMLPTLLEKLCEIDDLKWIRVHYFYNEAITDELIEVMAQNDKICNYVDLPIQHINDRILKRMARRTKRKDIEETIKKLRAKMCDVTIRTSIIVGFPGETEEEFSELYDFVKEIKFDRMGVFAYSAEEDTPAADFDDQIDDKTKQKRLDSLMSLQQQISYEKNQEKIGTVTEVLAEGYDKNNFMYFGRSRADSIGVDSTVYFAANDEVLPGDIVNVEILDADEYDLTGKQI